MRRAQPPPRRPPAARIAIAVAGFAVLGIGWRLTSAEPAAARENAVEAIAPDAVSDTPGDAAPADYMPDDPAPPPPTVDPLGSLPDAAQANDGPSAPLDFLRVTSAFGMRRHPILGFTRMHQGVDFAAKEGAPVLAAADGVVTDAGPAGGYGNLLRIKHAGGWATGYAHLSAFAPGIRTGVTVTRGEVVAFVGHTGLATGPHLHYEVSYDGVKLDPMTTPFGGAGASDPHAGGYARVAASGDAAPATLPAPTPAPATVALRGPLTTDAPGA